MVSLIEFKLAAGLAAVAQAHGVILGAQGPAGPPSVGFQIMVNPALARNCTTINPCQQDATLIRDAEISANVVNECGRTELTGNIDVGENTENALAAGAVTRITAGSDLIVTIHQVNADGAGPYVCDLDPTGNSLGLTGQRPLEITNNVPGVNGFSRAKAQQFNITVKLPADLACTGASTGNVCTVRCRNNAVAGPFGGCFAVQQTDVVPRVNTPANIATAKDLEGVLALVQQNQADLQAAIEANRAAGAEQALQNAAAVNFLLGIEATSRPAPVGTPAAGDATPPSITTVGSVTSAPVSSETATSGGAVTLSEAEAAASSESGTTTPAAAAADNRRRRRSYPPRWGNRAAWANPAFVDDTMA